jgi:hypothetical protein
MDVCRPKDHKRSWSRPPSGVLSMRGGARPGRGRSLLRLSAVESDAGALLEISHLLQNIDHLERRKEVLSSLARRCCACRIPMAQHMGKSYLLACGHILATHPCIPHDEVDANIGATARLMDPPCARKVLNRSFPCLDLKIVLCAACCGCRPWTEKGHAE